MLDWREIESVLVMRPDGIGDAVLTTPVFEVLKHLFPWTSQYVLARPEVCHLLQPDPHLAGTFPFVSTQSDQRLPELIRPDHLSELIARRFSLVIDFRGHLGNIRLARMLNPRYVASFDFQRTGLADSVPPSPPGVDCFFRDPRHQLDINADMMRHLGVRGKQSRPRLYLRPDDIRWAEQYRDSVLEYPGQPLVLVNPVATMRYSQWPLESSARLCREIADGFGSCVVVCGLPEHRDRLWQVANATPRPIVLAGAPNPSHLAALQSMAKMVVGVDSGACHMAAAVNTLVVVIFGGSNAASRWRPIGPNVSVVKFPIPCSPCHSNKCAQDFPCLTRVTVHDVMTAIHHLMGFLRPARTA